MNEIVEIIIMEGMVKIRTTPEEAENLCCEIIRSIMEKVAELSEPDDMKSDLLTQIFKKGTA